MPTVGDWLLVADHLLQCTLQGGRGLLLPRGSYKSRLSCQRPNASIRKLPHSYRQIEYKEGLICTSSGCSLLEAEAGTSDQQRRVKDRIRAVTPRQPGLCCTTAERAVGEVMTMHQLCESQAHRSCLQEKSQNHQCTRFCSFNRLFGNLFQVHF